MQAKGLVLLAVALLSWVAFAEPAEKTWQVTAKLVEIPSRFPPNDLYDYAFVMKYKVQGGPKDGQFIFVAHYNPRIKRSKIKDKMKVFVGGDLKRFKEGEVHKMTLDPNMEKIFDGTVNDDYFAQDRKSTRYWCLKVDRVE